jgi:hypothetical protein
VVEHPLGKGEVVSSILTGSTTESPTNKGFLRTHVKRALQNRAEQNAKRRAKTHQISTKCSPGVLLSDDQRTTAVKALTYAAALCSMLTAHYTPPLFHSDVTDLIETLAAKPDDVGRLVKTARKHLTKLGLKEPAPARADSS